ncbi:hypothetical protein DL96DRAFT_1081269 [Flagelloscypha sp. PMI_526]|nr:hypothetical protein DL96DRAFT_1081269 [Flagelloscypha sp. PMI_526]
MSENRKPANSPSLLDADIRRSIECLSFFLSTLRPGTSQRHESNSMGSALTHFATLLSSKGCNVAVTGSISISGKRPVSVPAFNGTISIAEHSRPLRDSVQSSEPRRYVISARIQNSQGPLLKEKFEQALHKMSHAAVPPKEHVEDLLTLYSLFKNNLVDSNMVLLPHLSAARIFPISFR